MKTVAYYRRSTNFQEHSLAMQKQKAFDTAMKKGFIIDQEYEDDAVSGRKTEIRERSQLNLLFQEIDQGKIRNLLVYKRDRLSRNAVQHIQLYRRLKHQNINVIFTADQEAPMVYSPSGELFELLMGAMVQREGEQIVERLKSSIQADFIAGKNPGKLPFGYSIDRETGRIIKDEEKLKLIRYLYTMLLNGQQLKEVVNYVRLTNHDRQWSTTSIRSLLQNPTYMGTRILNMKGLDPIFQEYSELSIIDEHEWSTVQEILVKSTKSLGSRTQYDFDFLLNDLLICSDCNQTLIGKSSNQKGAIKSYYKCSNGHASLPKSEIEQIVLEKCADYLNYLIDVDFEKLFNRYKIQNLTTLKNRIEQIDKCVSKTKNELFRKATFWLENEMSSVEKINVENQIIQKYEQISSFENSKESLLQEISHIEQLPDLLKRAKDTLLKENIITELAHNDFLKDLLFQISVDKYFVDVTFKYPFGGLKEAHMFDFNS